MKKMFTSLIPFLATEYEFQMREDVSNKYINTQIH